MRLHPLAGHQAHRLAFLDFGERAEILAVAEDRDPVGDIDDLVPAVRGEDDAAVLGAQVADEAEKPLDLAVAERRRRLVEKHRFGLLRDDPHDLDDLALGERQVLDERARVDVADAEAREHRVGLPRHPAAVDEAEPPARLARMSRFSATVIQGSSVSSWNTVHTPSACARSGPLICTGGALDPDFARVRPQPPAQKLDQRALAGAVFADERVHLSRMAEKDALSSARTPPNDLESFSPSTAVAGGSPAASDVVRGARRKKS